MIISNRDAKFMSEFWQAIFQHTGTHLGVTTAYHPNTDGQSEKSNDIFKVMLQCMLTQYLSESPWEDYLPEAEYFLLINPLQGLQVTLFKLLYGRAPTNEFSNELTLVPSADAFIKHRLQLHQEAHNFFHMAQVRMAYYYNKRRKPVELTGKVFIHLVRKVGDTGYTLPCLTTLSPVKMGPFKILKKVHELAYEIDVPESLGIHPVISVVHLEQAPEDIWDRQVQVVECEVEEAKYPFKVDEILDKKFRQISQEDPRKIWQYRVQWKDNGDSWEPASLIAMIAPTKTSNFEKKTTEPEVVDTSMEATFTRIEKNKEDLARLKPKHQGKG